MLGLEHHCGGEEFAGAKVRQAGGALRKFAATFPVHPPFSVAVKAKHALFLYAFGLCGDAIGSLLKIMHYPGADDTLMMATALKVSGILLLAIKLLKLQRLQEFLNS